MSTELGTEFGSEYGEDYGEIVASWGKKLKGISKVGGKLKAEWSSDLRKALEEQLIETLQKKVEIDQDLMSKESVERFIKVAVRRSLAEDHFDLLERLRIIANTEPEAITAAYSVDTVVSRAPQTVSQIFDMVKDKFNQIMEKTLRKKKKLTGNRRWVSQGEGSRHRNLNGQVKKEGEFFVYKGAPVYGPRPPGGSPENWSNCSCYLVFERGDGDWVRM